MQFLFLLSLVSATSYALAHESPSHPVEKRLPATWFHERDHPVNKLFKRAEIDGIPLPEVGSDEWKKAYPTDKPDANDVPEAWASALEEAVSHGKIPTIPWTTQKDGGDPTYPVGTDPNSPEVCSSTYKCRSPGSIWDGPANYFGISFDDGPLPFSDSLLDFLKRKNEKATHFMIGQNILENPNQFKKTFDQGHDIAVHTYTHRAMTTLSNKDIVAELGWTMQIIHDSTGGRVPKFWRPPYGDSDTRVQAVAREVFGLKTIIWNQDTNDWGIAEGSQKKSSVTNSMSKFLKMSKKTGLVVLEHESSKQAVDIFINAYPSIKSNGWKTKSLAQLVGNNNAYQNVNGNDIRPDDRFLEHHDAPKEDGPDEPEEDEPEDDGEPDDAPAPPEDEGDDGDDGDDEDGGEVLPTMSSSADEPETTSEDSEDSSSSDEDSSSSDDSSSEDSDSSSSDDEDSSSSDDSDSSSDDSDSSSSDDDDKPTSTKSDDDAEPSETSDKKDNGALTLAPRIAGFMSGSLLIMMCIAPAVVMVLG